MCEAKDAEVVIFDNDLSPAQVRNLEKATNAKVIDRSELILDIFATRARTIESKLQVELAQLEYSLPRLKRMWTHLSRYKGGIGLRGPGETQLEEDRRLVGLKIRDLKERLSHVQTRKQREVSSRFEEHTVSLVGYTNAGKSTLMNKLTGAGVYVEDKLFSTLDTRTRQWRLADWGRVLLSRYRRLHPRFAPPSRGVVQGDPGGSPASPAVAPRRRCRQPSRGGAHSSPSRRCSKSSTAIHGPRCWCSTRSTA